MAYSDTNISIHLVKDVAVTSLDDTVKIVKNLDDNMFELTYTDKGDPLVHKVHYMTRDDVCDYVYNLFMNFTLDEDGYQLIQFSLPAMPRVMVSGSKLKDASYREHFLELIEYGLGLLDKVEKVVIKKPSEKKTTSRSNCEGACYNTPEPAYCLRSSTTSPCCSKNKNTVFTDMPCHRYFE